MLLNLFILLFIIGLAYWQGIQGFFSALIHLILVIVAGALAFAFWEPMAMGMLSGVATRFAWTLALIVPFFTYLLILRFLFDKFVPANVDFSQLTNLIAGGVCGAIAAVLTMGIFVIGIIHLPGDRDNFGYQPYTIDPVNGAVVKNQSGGSLWIPVESITESFFSSLSAGSFAPANGKSLAYDKPDFVRSAVLARLRTDPHTSSVATPGTVVVTNHYSSPLPLNNLPDIFFTSLPKTGTTVQNDIREEKNRLIAIETTWTNADRTFDGDPRLRVYPTQAQLITGEKGKPDALPKVHLPIALSRLVNKTLSEREFAVVNSDNVMLASDAGKETTITFFYLVPANQVERFLRVRGLRLLLPGTEAALATAAPDKIAEALGTSLAIGTTGTGTGPTTGGVTVVPADIDVSADLPKPTSLNLAGALQFAARNEITGGEATVKLPSGGGVSPANLVTKLLVPEQQACVRLKLTRASADSFYNKVVASKDPKAIVITDTEGTPWEPHGFVWYKVGSHALNIRFEPRSPIKDVTDLPIKGMDPNDELYVYFLVKKDIRLDKLKVGTVLSVELNRFEVK